MIISNGWGEDSVKSQLTYIIQEAKKEKTLNILNGGSRECIMSREKIEVVGLKIPKCDSKWVSGKRVACRKCSIFYNKLKTKPLKECMATDSQNNRICPDLHQNDHDICGVHLCPCVTDNPEYYNPGYLVVCARKAKLPWLSKDIWRIIFEYCKPRVFKIDYGFLGPFPIYHSPLAFTNKKFFPDATRILSKHGNKVLCRSAFIEGCMKSNKCYKITDSEHSVCIQCRGLSIANGKKFFSLVENQYEYPIGK